MQQIESFTKGGIGPSPEAERMKKPKDRIPDEVLKEIFPRKLNRCHPPKGVTELGLFLRNKA
jgi:hypothetical protein